jgi:hypothetical protein
VAVGELRLSEMLEAVEEFGSASLELIAWEFDIPEDVLRPMWLHAIAEYLLQPAGENESGEPDFCLATLAHTWLATAPETSRRAVAVCLQCGRLRKVQEVACERCARRGTSIIGAPPPDSVVGILERLSDRAAATASGRDRSQERALLTYARAFERRGPASDQGATARLSMLRARIRELERTRGKDAFCAVVARRLAFGDEPDAGPSVVVRPVRQRSDLAG